MDHSSADASPDQIWPLIDCLYNTPEWVLSPDSLTARIFLELKRTLDAELGDHTTQAIDILRRARILDEVNITTILQHPLLYAFNITLVLRDEVRALITAGTLTLEQVLALTPYASYALQDAGVHELITDGILTAEHLAEITTHAASIALRDAGVRALISAGTLTIPQVLALTAYASYALQDAGVHELITDGILTAEHLAEITTHAASIALQDAGVRAFITAGTLTIPQVLALTPDACYALQDAGVHELITDGILTAGHLAEITTHAASMALQDAGVRTLITEGTLTIPQVLALTPYASHALQDAGVHELITDGILTAGHLAEITTHAASMALRDAGVRAFITAGTLTIPQVLALTPYASYALQDAGVHELITDGILTAGHLAEITTHAARMALQDAGVRAFITAGTLTIPQVLALTFAASDALRDPDTQRMLRLGRITFAEILAPVHHHAHDAAAVAHVINPGQSTHTASVHRTVSESAIRLAKRYGSMIEAPGLEETIKKLQAQVLSLPGRKNQAAKDCIKRITKVDYFYTDDKSGITTRQLLALIFLAISDDKTRRCSHEEAMARFVQGLYEIQRGYNLDGHGVDNGEDDRPICTGGTFNKLIATLVGVHPDFEIRYITRETAALKLPKVVQEEAMLYLTTLKKKWSRQISQSL